jgi:hypothetical protein
LRYLAHIEEIWNDIALGIKQFKEAVDIQTVLSLEGLCPGVSKADRELVIDAMRHGLLFPSITDKKQREMILDALLDVKCLIPSIKSMHENLKLVEAGAKILKTLIVGKNSRLTLHRALYDAWNKTPNAYIELSDGPYRIPQDYSTQRRWDLVYKELWLLAFKGFADLGGRPPRKETGQSSYTATADLYLQFRFAESAQRLGIVTQKISDRLLQDPRRESIRVSLTDMYKTQPSAVVESLVDAVLKELPPPTEPAQIQNRPVRASLGARHDLARRWGVPFKNAYMAAKMELFLPVLAMPTTQPANDMPNAMFIYKDFMDSFFGTTPEFQLATENDDDLLREGSPMQTSSVEEDQSYEGSPLREETPQVVAPNTLAACVMEDEMEIEELQGIAEERPRSPAVQISPQSQYQRGISPQSFSVTMPISETPPIVAKQPTSGLSEGMFKIVDEPKRSVVFSNSDGQSLSNLSQPRTFSLVKENRRSTLQSTILNTRQAFEDERSAIETGFATDDGQGLALSWASEFRNAGQVEETIISNRSTSNWQPAIRTKPRSVVDLRPEIETSFQAGSSWLVDPTRAQDQFNLAPARARSIIERKDQSIPYQLDTGASLQGDQHVGFLPEDHKAAPSESFESPEEPPKPSRMFNDTEVGEKDVKTAMQATLNRKLFIHEFNGMKCHLKEYSEADMTIYLERRVSWVFMIHQKSGIWQTLQSRKVLDSIINSPDRDHAAVGAEHTKHWMQKWETYLQKPVLPEPSRVEADFTKVKQFDEAWSILQCEKEHVGMVMGFLLQITPNDRWLCRSNMPVRMKQNTMQSTHVCVVVKGDSECEELHWGGLEAAMAFSHVWLMPNGQLDEFMLERSRCVSAKEELGPTEPLGGGGADNTSVPRYAEIGAEKDFAKLPIAGSEDLIRPASKQKSLVVNQQDGDTDDEIGGPHSGEEELFEAEDTSEPSTSPIEPLSPQNRPDSERDEANTPRRSVDSDQTVPMSEPVGTVPENVQFVRLPSHVQHGDAVPALETDDHDMNQIIEPEGAQASRVYLDSQLALISNNAGRTTRNKHKPKAGVSKRPPRPRIKRVENSNAVSADESQASTLPHSSSNFKYSEGGVNAGGTDGKNDTVTAVGEHEATIENPGQVTSQGGVNTGGTDRKNDTVTAAGEHEATIENPGQVTSQGGVNAGGTDGKNDTVTAAGEHEATTNNQGQLPTDEELGDSEGPNITTASKTRELKNRKRLFVSDDDDVEISATEAVEPGPKRQRLGVDTPAGIYKASQVPVLESLFVFEEAKYLQYNGTMPGRPRMKVQESNAILVDKSQVSGEPLPNSSFTFEEVEARYPQYNDTVPGRPRMNVQESNAIPADKPQVSKEPLPDSSFILEEEEARYPQYNDIVPGRPRMNVQESNAIPADKPQVSREPLPDSSFTFENSQGEYRRMHKDHRRIQSTFFEGQPKTKKRPFVSEENNVEINQTERIEPKPKRRKEDEGEVHVEEVREEVERAQEIQ